MTLIPSTKSGLRWRKLDLHVHTPASKDYSGPVITPEQFVAQALAKGLNGIAVTDHNSGEWIDRMVAAARGTDLTIFPGVEITVTGGKHGIHVIALFDISATTKTVENLLSKLGFNASDYGKLEALSELGPDAVVDRIHEVGGLAILAHADSSKGVLADMQGQQRTNVMNSLHLAAVELTDIVKNAKFCSGQDPAYRRKLAYYRSSDNPVPAGGHGHSIDGVGQRYSWFKSDGLSLEALKQVFHDPDQRIKCDEETADIPDRMYPRILSLEVSAGFLKGLVFRFHEGLNSIIGGKGVGKSLLVEFLRFTLDQSSSIDDLRSDMEGKLTKQLGAGAQVTVSIQLEADQVIDITRTYDGNTNPIQATYGASGKRVAADIAQLFPVLAYSQTETIAIAKDNNAQLRLIDSFLDLATIEAQIKSLEEQLAKSDSDLAEAEGAHDRLEKAEKDLATHDDKMAALERALRSKELDTLNELRPKSACMEALDLFANEIEGAIEDLEANLKSPAPPKLPAKLADDKALERLLLQLSTDARAMLASARQLQVDVRALAKRAREAAMAWNKVVASKRKEYQEFVKKQGGERPALLARKTALEEQRPALASVVAALKQRIASLPNLRAARTQLIGTLDAEIDKRHALRKEKYAELTAASNGRLDLQLKRGGERGRYLAAMLRLKTGSRLQDSTIEQVCQHVEPRQFLTFLRSNDATGLLKAAHISSTSASTLVNHLNATSDVKGVLALEHGELLQDSPHIRFRKSDGQYYDLKDLSVGQKCTALLIIALAEGTRPIVIDQPEDALDITSVYEDVTLQLRSRKNARQFILTTHNPTVAVAGDSDEFHVLTASATQAALTIEGAIDLPFVREAVIQHLEGGPEPFALKSKKYGLPLS